MANKFLCLLLSLIILFSSCANSDKVISSSIIQKRKYSKGFFIDLFAKKLKPNKKVVSVNKDSFEVKNEPGKIPLNLEVSIENKTPIVISNLKSELPEPIIDKKYKTKLSKTLLPDKIETVFKNEIDSTKIISPIEKPKTHPDALMSFILSLLSPLLILLTLGIIVSAVIHLGNHALEEINNEPKKWKGKGLVKVAFIIILTIAAAYLIFILFLVGVPLYINFGLLLLSFLGIYSLVNHKLR